MQKLRAFFSSFEIFLDENLQHNVFNYIEWEKCVYTFCVEMWDFANGYLCATLPSYALIPPLSLNIYS